MMMTHAQYIMEAVGQFMTRTTADEKRNAAYESYYARHRVLYEEEDTTTQMTMGSYKRADYEEVKHLEEQHLQLVAQAREIIKRRDVPGYITDEEEIGRIVDDNFEAECGQFTDEELATFIGVQEDSEQLAIDMQRRRLAGEDITKYPRYREYLSSQMGMEPTTLGTEGLQSGTERRLLRRQQSEQDHKTESMHDSTTSQDDNVAVRQAYVNEVRALSDLEQQLRSEGKSLEEIARTLHQTRRDLGVKYKNLTSPDKLEEIYQRNLTKYGDKLGPTFDYLLEDGKKYEQIIESAKRPGKEYNEKAGVK